MSKQKTVLFGAPGKILDLLLEEALKRKHTVRAIVYDVSKVHLVHPNLEVRYGHMANKDKVAEHISGFDSVIAVNEPIILQPNEHVKVAKSLIEATKKARLEKLILIGHPVYCPVENTVEFYSMWKMLLHTQQEALRLFQNKVSLDWHYVHSPRLEPNPITGRLMPPENFLVTSNEGVILLHRLNYVRELLDMAEKNVTVAGNWAESMLLSI